MVTRKPVHHLDPAGHADGEVARISGGKFTIGPPGTDAETVRDIIGAALVQGANVTITVNDAGDTITIAAATDPEVVRDTIGAALVQGAGVTITVDDAGDHITIAVPSTTTRLVPLVTVNPSGDVVIVFDSNDEMVWTEIPA